MSSIVRCCFFGNVCQAEISTVRVLGRGSVIRCCFGKKTLHSVGYVFRSVLEE